MRGPDPSGPPTAVSEEAHDRLVERARRSLVTRGAPRLQMSFMVSATGLAGLGASVLLRHLGLESMGPRYALAVACAYLAFLFLLWLWLAWQGRPLRSSAVREERRAGDRRSGLDLGDLADLASSGPADPSPAPWRPGGGRFSGGGATYDLSLAESPPSPPTTVSSGGSGGSGSGFSFGLDLDLDEAVAVVLALVAIACVVFAAGYVVFQAPTLLADLLVDGALSAGLYRRLRGGGQGSWWSGAVRRTVFPALVVLVFFALAGWAIQRAWPEAATLGDAWRLLLA